MHSLLLTFTNTYNKLTDHNTTSQYKNYNIGSTLRSLIGQQINHQFNQKNEHYPIYLMQVEKYNKVLSNMWLSIYSLFVRGVHVVYA